MAEQILEFSHVYKLFPGFALKDISFSVEAGSIAAVLGADGAGKTSLLRCILRLCLPDDGEIRLFGMDLRKREADIRQRIGFCGAPGHFYGKKIVADLVNVTRSFYRQWDHAEYQKYLRIFHIDETLPLSWLTPGMLAKLDLAVAMGHGAEMLILDEPTAGLDARSRGELLQTFKELRRKGLTILFTTRIISDLESCADYLIYLRGGEIVASEALSDFVAYRRVRGFGENLRKIMAHYERGTLDASPAY